MGVQVSVVVPVFNSGPGLDDLVTSLVGQTLPTGEVEVLLCDDGSDAFTQSRLDAFERAHPQVRVLKLPHSGWPGAPRNAGLDAAAGEYVFFADHDDRLGLDALRRMTDYAHEHGSDVVVGKVTGVGRGVPRRIFARSIPKAVLGEDPILDLLTPHKLFRTAFLREHGIRFPDGRVRLEDHMLVMKTYFAADVISVYADYPCYYWVEREDRPSASAGLIDPESYYPHMATVLDIVEANTRPGAERDRLMVRWYRGKILKRLGNEYLPLYPDGYQDRLIDTVMPLVERYFPPSVDAYLPTPMRARSALLRAGRRADLNRLGASDATLKAKAKVTSVDWDEAGRLLVGVRAQVRGPGGSPAQLPADIAPDVLTPELLDDSADRAGDGLEVVLKDMVDGSAYIQEQDRGRRDLDDLLLTAVIDTRIARSGRAVTGRSEFVIGIAWRGWTFSRILRVDKELLAESRTDRTVARRRFSVRRAGKDRLILVERPVPPPVPIPGWMKTIARQYVPLKTRRKLVRRVRSALRRYRTIRSRIGRPGGS